MIKHRGITFVEVLVAAGIIAALIAISLPALNLARARSSATASTGNLQQIGLALLMYNNEAPVGVPRPVESKPKMPVLSITVHYIHIVTACVLFGGAFFFCVLLPIGVRRLDPQTQADVFLGSRRALKMVVHTAFLLLLATGICTAVLNWPIYTRWPAVMHGLFGLHLLLGLSALVLLMIATAGREPLRLYRTIAKVGVVILFFAVLAASVLRWERENPPPPSLPLGFSNLH